jgi:hypothetical protein
MLGIALRLVEKPLAYGSTAYLATVTSGSRLRVAAVMTPPHRLQVYADDDGDLAGLRLVAEALWRAQWTVPGVIAREALTVTFAELWGRRTGARCRLNMRLRAYELRQVVEPWCPPGEFRQAVVEDVDLVRQWACAFADECFGDGGHVQSMASAEEKVMGGKLFLWVDGAPVSMAARSRPTPHGEAVSLVYTPPGKRRNGYASAVVARLSQMILRDGKEFCTLFTDLSNPTSNSIYQKIGYSAVADVVQTDFVTDQEGVP